MRLFSYRPQVTLKCGRNKKLAHEALSELVIDVLTTFLMSSVIYIKLLNTPTAKWNLLDSHQ